MELFTSILISIVASVVGVQADVTLWKTSTQVMEANTVWSTETYTETAWSTYIPPAVTISVPYTVEKEYTDIVSIPYTVTSVIEKDYTTTITSVVISTVTQVGPPVTVKQPTTITIPPTTVTFCTTTSLTGIVTCPSRTINPTYTASTPFPDDYTWGCPPGTLCQPPQINCNFEQNPPADGYYCSPDECVPAPPLPSFTPAPIVDGTCGPYPTPSGFFNFDPEDFGLSYSIFVDGGDYAESCQPPSTTYVPPPPSTTYVPPPPYSTYAPQSYSTYAPHSYSTYAPQSYSTTWAPVTTISHKQPWVTTAARLARRANPPLPSACFQDCDQCLIVAQQAGKQSQLCLAGSLFSAAYGHCEACIASHIGATNTVAGAVLQSLDPFTSYCNGLKVVSPHPITAPSTPSPSTPSTTPISTSPTPLSSISQTLVTTPISPTTVVTSTPPCVVSQISDGQPQECTGTSTAPVATFSGAAGHTLSPPSIFWSSPMGWALLLLVNALPI
jgi:hypothetical protein